MTEHPMSIDELAVIVKEGFDEVTRQFDGVAKRFDGVAKRFDGINTRLDRVERRLGKVEATMVTKSYLDDKLADLEGTVIVRQRKEDQKVNLLIDLVRKRAVLKEDDVRSLREIQVFPSLPRS